MVLKLMDWEGKTVEHEVGNIDDIGLIEIEVISGDEVATVIYKDYTVAKYDSSGCRNVDYADYAYTLYNTTKGINLLDDPKWKNRESSYWYDLYEYECEE